MKLLFHSGRLVWDGLDDDPVLGGQCDGVPQLQRPLAWLELKCVLLEEPRQCDLGLLHRHHSATQRSTLACRAVTAAQVSRVFGSCSHLAKQPVMEST